MTTKLIQELVCLCVEKGLRFEFDPSGNYIDLNGNLLRSNFIFLDDENAPEQLQSAIDKVKGL